MIYATFIQIEFGSRKKEGLKRKDLKCRGERSLKISFLLFDSIKIFVCCLHPSKQNNKIFIQIFRCVIALWNSWVCKYSIRFQVLNSNFYETLINKNKKFLLDIQTKYSNIANEILNAAINAEQNFKCKWPYLLIKVNFKSICTSSKSIKMCIENVAKKLQENKKQ